MEKFEFHNPVRVIFGPGEVKRVGTEAKALGKKALVVSYKDHAFSSDLLSRVEKDLAAAGVTPVSFYEVTANPTIEQVEAGVKAAKAAGVDVVIGIGGGSAMDAAKVIAAGVLYPLEPWRMIVARHDKADAVSHVMELYLNGVDDTPFQDRLMEGIILTVMECAAKLQLNAKDLAARTNLMWAATVAWNGWTNPGCASTTPMHLVAHTISAHFHVTHGATLAIVMHAWMRRFCKNRLPRYAQFGERVFGMSAKGKGPEKFALEVIDRFESWRKGLGVQTMLPELGVGKDKIDMLMDDIVRVSFGADGKLGARVPASKDDVRAILQLAL